MNQVPERLEITTFLILIIAGTRRIAAWNYDTTIAWVIVILGIGSVIGIITIIIPIVVSRVIGIDDDNLLPSPIAMMISIAIAKRSAG